MVGPCFEERRKMLLVPAGNVEREEPENGNDGEALGVHRRVEEGDDDDDRSEDQKAKGCEATGQQQDSANHLEALDDRHESAGYEGTEERLGILAFNRWCRKKVEESVETENDKRSSDEDFGKSEGNVAVHSASEYI